MLEEEEEDKADIPCCAQRIHMLSRSSWRRRWYSVHMLPPRRCWEYPLSSDWWTKFVMSVWDDERWIKHFRMSKETLASIATQLRPCLRRQSTVMRKPIPVFKRVAMFVWWLANVASYRELSEQFGVGISTAAEIVIEVCLAMELDLLKRYVRLGNVRQVSLFEPFTNSCICTVVISPPYISSSAFSLRHDVLPLFFAGLP